MRMPDLVRLAFLAPDIVAVILAGKQSAGLTANKLGASIGGISEPRWGSRNPIVHPLHFIPGPKALGSAPDGDRRSPVVSMQNCRLARRRKDRKVVPGDPAVRDSRTTESRLRDSRTESGREWPGNRLYGVSEKCIRHKPRDRGQNSTPVRSSA